jgi:hypothetical protein
MMSTETSRQAVECARGARVRRAGAARLLAATPGRAAVPWQDLSALPDWASWPAERLEALAWAAGAWRHAAALRRCIDGRVLAMLRERLGPHAAQQLSASTGCEEASQPASDPCRFEASSPAQIDTWLRNSGRSALLDGIPSDPLRSSLRAALWQQAADAAHPALPATDARALTLHALAHFLFSDTESLA